MKDEERPAEDPGPTLPFVKPKTPNPRRRRAGTPRVDDIIGRSPFAISNDLVRLYADRFARLHPELGDFFEKSKRTVSDKREKELQEKARRYHAKHPLVWKRFEAFALEMYEKGFRRYSADAVMHRVRWETDAARISAVESVDLSKYDEPSSIAHAVAMLRHDGTVPKTVLVDGVTVSGDWIRRAFAGETRIFWPVPDPKA